MIPEPLDFEKPILELEKKLSDIRDYALESNIDMSNDIKKIEAKLTRTKEDIYNNLSSWQRVQIARHPKRPYMLDYVESCFDDFLELHGDRHIKDDQSMPGGFATLEGKKVVVIGHQKGRNTKDNLKRNFGSAHPEGYRKALRLMKLAEKFSLPIISFIDTPGAYPGIESEQRNIAEAIAFNLREMITISVPFISIIIGEGGSGGALGIGVSDRILMLENAYYSVISPEGCAAILWKDRKYASDAAKALKLSSSDLLEFGIIDEIIPEPMGGAHHDLVASSINLKSFVIKTLNDIEKESPSNLINKRYERYRNIGNFKDK